MRNPQENEMTFVRCSKSNETSQVYNTAICLMPIWKDFLCPKLYHPFIDFYIMWRKNILL